MDQKVTVIAFSGSLRKDSWNTMLLKEAVGFAPSDMEIEIVDISEFPPFNQDHETDPPKAVAEVKLRVKDADAVLFVTPEYNYSIPGVLKNAIDWLSRPYGTSAWEDKPVALISASTGMLGGARAQYHLRQTFVFLNMHPVNRPEVIVNFAPQKFDDQGNLTDLKTKELISELLKNLSHWTRRLRSEA